MSLSIIFSDKPTEPVKTDSKGPTCRTLFVTAPSWPGVSYGEVLIHGGTLLGATPQKFICVPE